MRHVKIWASLAIVALGLSACMGNDNAVDKQLEAVNSINGAELDDVMLTVADPNEAAVYFKRTSLENPESIAAKRGLGLSLTRAKRAREASTVWADVITHPEATNEDSVNYANALIRSGNWDKAEDVLNAIPPTHETYDRYRLEAIVADSQKNWKRADSFYEIATGLTTTPANVLNNWGYSKLTRGSHKDAERLFVESLKHDQSNFTVKNNLILARAAQGIYTLPAINMTQTERAELLHTMGLSAVKRGDVSTAKSIFREAVETHPQYFEAAVRSLDALENS